MRPEVVIVDLRVLEDLSVRVFREFDRQIKTYGVSIPEGKALKENNNLKPILIITGEELPFRGIGESILRIKKTVPLILVTIKGGFFTIADHNCRHLDKAPIRFLSTKNDTLLITQTIKDLRLAWSRVIVQGIQEKYEALYREPQQISTKISLFLKWIVEILSAKYAQPFFLHQIGGYYNPEFGNADEDESFNRIDPELIDDILRSSPGEGDTRLLRLTKKNQILPFRPAVDSDFDQIVISSFSLGGQSCLVVYNFGEKHYNGYIIEKICSAFTRELFHLIRSGNMKASMHFIQQLLQIEELHSEKDKVFNKTLEIIKKHFRCQGVSIVEKKDVQSGGYLLEKTYRHHGRFSSVFFLANKGFAHYCLNSKKALLVARTEIVNGQAIGHAYEFSPNKLDANSARKSTVHAIIAPGTPPEENETSLAYFPLIHDKQILGLIKLSEFKQKFRFDLHDLRELSLYAKPLATFLGNVSSIGSRIEISVMKRKIAEKASTLFFYREVSLGVFHQVSNYLRSSATDLLLAESFLSSKKQDVERTSELLKEAKKDLDDAVELIARVQERGESLKPVLRRCLFIKDIAYPIIEQVKRRAKEKKIIIETSLGRFDYTVRADSQLLKEAIINITNNAIWAIDENSSSNKKRLFIGIRKLQEDKFLEINIADSGIGIEVEILPKIFDPFFSTRKNGTGLGLHLSRDLLKEHEGSLDVVRTRPGKGTLVRISLPYKAESYR